MSSAQPSAWQVVDTQEEWGPHSYIQHTPHCGRSQAARPGIREPTLPEASAPD